MKPLVERMERGPLRVYTPTGSHNVIVFEGVLREQILVNPRLVVKALRVAG